MRRWIKVITAICLMTVINYFLALSATDLVKVSAQSASGALVQNSQAVGVTFHTHVQNVGWEPVWATDEGFAGTEGEGLRLEGIEIKLIGNLPIGAKIEYRTHVQNQGWEKYWSQDGNASGSQGMSQRLEGIQIQLVNMPGYSVEYRTHIQNMGWEKTWAKNGEVSGTVGQGLRLESIQIRIVKENADLTAYQELLEEIKKTAAADYTTYSWNNLQAVIKANVVTIRNTQEEVNQATTLIAAAFEALESEADAKVYEKSGTYGPATGLELITQDVVIKADGVTLQNLRIRGDLIVSEEVGLGNVTLNNIIVEGETYIRGGGKNSIHINGGSYRNIIVQQTASGKVRIVATNSEGIDVIIAEDAGGEEIILEGSFASVMVDAPGMKISTQGKTSIEEMTIARRASGSQFNLDANSQVGRLVINGKTTVKGQGRIVKAEVNADNVTYEKKPEQQTVGKNVRIPPKTPPILVTAVSVDSAGSTSVLTKGSSLQMSATVSPADADNKKLVWTVINGTGTASISSSGLLTGTAVGTVTVKAATQDVSGISGTKQITITEIKTGIIATTSLITAGSTNPSIVVTLTEDTFTANATVISNWTTSMGTSGLTVNSITKDSESQVTIKMTGTAVPGTVSLKANALALTKGQASNNLSVTCSPILVTAVTVGTPGNVTTVTKGSNLQMTAAVLPVNATNKNITWSVTNETGAATINSQGLLTPTIAGTITVKATAQDASGKYGAVTITVLEPVVATISTTTGIESGSINPAIVVALTNDTFTANADSLSNWTTSVGNTGLRILAVSRDNDRQVTIFTTGTSAPGTMSFQTKAGGLTKGAASNVLAITVTGITNFANTAVTDQTASFSWTPTTGATSVKLQQALKDTNNWIDANTGALTASSTGATVSGLTQLTDYDFRLVVVGGSSAGVSNILKGIKTAKTEPVYVSQVTKAAELNNLAGVYSVSFIWSSNQGVGTQNPTVSGNYTYYEDGAYLRFQVLKVSGDDATVMKFCDVFETGLEVNDTVGGMTLQTGTGTVSDMDGSFRERADWGLTGYEGYETDLPNSGNYLFYGVIQKVDYGTKTVGFGSADVRDITMTLTPKTGLPTGNYRVTIETMQQGAEESENGNLIFYDFTV